LEHEHRNNTIEVMNQRKEEDFLAIKERFDACTYVVIKQLKLLEGVLMTEPYRLSDVQYEQLMQQEEQIDEHELFISDRVIAAIGLFNPMARELRQLISYYRISIDLEKMGDLAVSTARLMRSPDDHALFSRFSESFGDMLSIVITMVEKALFSFTESDLDYAVWTIRNDDAVDDLHHHLRRNFVRKELPALRTDPELATLVDMMSIVTCIERIADHATNIAEAAIFTQIGEDMRHRDPGTIGDI